MNYPKMSKKKSTKQGILFEKKLAPVKCSPKRNSSCLDGGYRKSYNLRKRRKSDSSSFGSVRRSSSSADCEVLKLRQISLKVRAVSGKIIY